MTRILLENLTPGVAYNLQLRSIGSEGPSEWSRIFNFTTTIDTIAPATPTNVTASMSGTAFVLTWDPVTLSSDGSSAYDLDTYVVKVTSTGSANVGLYKIKGLRFEFSFEMNRALFGTPQANVSLSVAAADVVGNISPYSTPASQTNAAPSTVTGLAVSAAQDQIIATWDVNTDTDFDHFEMHVGTTSGFTTNSGTLKWSGKSTSVTYPTSLYSTTLYVVVYAVDVFGTLSSRVQAGPISPTSAFVVDTTAPDVPTGLSATLATSVDQRTIATVSWTAVANPNNDLQGYVLRYKASADSDYQYMTFDNATTSANVTIQKPYVNYDFAVRSFDMFANYSAYSSTVTATGASNSAPAQVTGLSVVAGVQSVIAQWTENTELDVINGAGSYQVQIDTANTFSTGNLKTGTTSGTILSFTGLPSNTLYYVRVRAVDSLGLTGTYSSTSSVTTGLITNGDIAAGSISGDKITAATLAGDRVIANTLDANVLKANTSIIQNLTVASTLTMGDASNNGIIKSFGFSTGVTGWQISKTGFEVNQGTIAAAALLIQDSDNVLPPQYADFEFASSFYTGQLTQTNITSLAVNTTTPRFNSQILRASWTTAGSNPTLFLGSSNTNYNVNVDASSTYILSVYARNTGSVSTVLRGGVKLSNATTVQAFSVTPTTSSSTWVRYSGTVAIPSGINTCIVYFDSTTLTTGAGFDLDGLQLEKQISGATTPSQWTPPGATRIDGGIIRTGTIISSATITVNSVAQPSWSINTQGAAQFGDVSVRGRILVGGSGSDPDAGQSFISSGNFSTGSTGWKIDSAGVAEFQSGTFRGTINATSGTFSGTISATGTISGGTISGASLSGGSLSVPAAGTVGTSSPGEVHIDNNGLYMLLDATTNLIPNPSFELGPTTSSSTNGHFDSVTLQGPTYTDFYGNIDTSAFLGIHSGLVMSTSGGNEYVDILLGAGTTLSLSPGSVYSLSVYVAAGSATWGTAFSGSLYANISNFGIIEKTTGGTRIQRSSGIDRYLITDGGPGLFPGVLTGVQRLANDGWNYRWMITFTLNAAASTSSDYYLRLPAPCTSGGAGDSTHALFYDAMQLEAKPYVTKYCDGDQPDCSWSGSRHASKSSRAAGTYSIWIPSMGEPRLNGKLVAIQMNASKIKVGSGPVHGSTYVEVLNHVGQSIPSGTTWVDVQYDSAIATDRSSQDDGQVYDGSTFQFTAPTQGFYMFSVAFTFSNNSTGDRGLRFINSNGNVVAQISTSASGGNVTNLSRMIYMDANGWVKAQVRQTSGSTLTSSITSTAPNEATFAYMGGI